MKNQYKLRPGEKKTYRMGKHFKVYHTLAYVAVTLVVYGFYTIYDYLFVSENSIISGFQMLLIFIFLEVIFMVAITKGGNWIKKNYYYELDDRGVTIVLSKNRTTYTWDKFQEVSMGMHSFIDLCPVRYKYDGKKLTFSQYLEEMFDMHLIIIDKISDHVEVPEGLISQLNAFSKD